MGVLCISPQAVAFEFFDLLQEVEIFNVKVVQLFVFFAQLQQLRVPIEQHALQLHLLIG